MSPAEVSSKESVRSPVEETNLATMPPPAPPPNLPPAGSHPPPFINGNPLSPSAPALAFVLPLGVIAFNVPPPSVQVPTRPPGPAFDPAATVFRGGATANVVKVDA